MAVEETLTDEELADLEKLADLGMTTELEPGQCFKVTISPQELKLAIRELINLRALWKAKRLWRYAGVPDEDEAGLETCAELYKSSADWRLEQLKRLDYYLRHTWAVLIPNTEAIVDEAIRIMERCRGRQDASPWSDSDRAAIDEFVKTEPAPDWHPPTDWQPPSGGPADPVPSELYQGEIDEVEVHDHPLSPGEIAKKVHENQGRRVARGPRPEAERGSGEGRGSVGPPAEDEKPEKTKTETERKDHGKRSKGT